MTTQMDQTKPTPLVEVKGLQINDNIASNLLQSPKKCSAAVASTTMRVQQQNSIIVSTHEEMNPNRRKEMEDVHVVHEPGTWNAPDPNMAYLAIYDGHGGRDMVEYLEHGLSFHVAQELRHIHNNNNTGNNDYNDNDTSSNKMQLCLERAFLMADCHAAQCGVSTSGATVIVCLVKRVAETNQTIIYCANAGDARAVLCHQGTTTRLSRDHRGDDPDEAERIKKSGGIIFKGRVLGVLAVSRSLGDHCMKNFVIAKPHYNEITINNNKNNNFEKQSKENSSVKRIPNVLVLACDGLWDVMDDQEVIDLALQCEHKKTEVAQILIAEAIRRGSTDNISVVVAWL